MTVMDRSPEELKQLAADVLALNTPDYECGDEAQSTNNSNQH